jgi:excisionase family DNA binding protein
MTALRNPAEYLTVDEAAALARCHPKTIRKAFESGALPASRPAHRVLIRADDVRAWIEARPAAGTERRDPTARPRRPARRAPDNVAALRAMDPDLKR